MTSRAGPSMSQRAWLWPTLGLLGLFFRRFPHDWPNRMENKERSKTEFVLPVPVIRKSSCILQCPLFGCHKKMEFLKGHLFASSDECTQIVQGSHFHLECISYCKTKLLAVFWSVRGCTESSWCTSKVVFGRFLLFFRWWFHVEIKGHSSIFSSSFFGAFLAFISSIFWAKSSGAAAAEPGHKKG